MADSKTYLAIHSGHTRTKFGLFEMKKGEKSPLCLISFHVENGDPIPWELIEEETENPSVCSSVLTGSNRELWDSIQQHWSERFPVPVTLSENSLIPIKSLVDVPEKVGADRLLNAVAVNRLRSPGAASVIVDSGTAVTVDVINSEGEFLGGAILPGVLMGARALNEFTTTLPLIDGRKFLEEAPSSLGKNTEAAMASGLYWGHLGAVKELVERISGELGEDTELYLTGGALPILEPYLPQAIGERNLSLIGTVITLQALQEAS